MKDKLKINRINYKAIFVIRWIEIFQPHPCDTGGAGCGIDQPTGAGGAPHDICGAGCGIDQPTGAGGAPHPPPPFDLPP